VHQVRDAMRDDSGFAGTGAGEDEERAFGMLDGLTLTGVEALQKVHESSFYHGGPLEPR
jgi:hypothetical protein